MDIKSEVRYIRSEIIKIIRKNFPFANLRPHQEAGLEIEIESLLSDECAPASVGGHEEPDKLEAAVNMALDSAMIGFEQKVRRELERAGLVKP